MNYLKEKAKEKAPLCVLVLHLLLWTQDNSLQLGLGNDAGPKIQGCRRTQNSEWGVSKLGIQNSKMLRTGAMASRKSLNAN